MKIKKIGVVVIVLVGLVIIGSSTGNKSDVPTSTSASVPVVKVDIMTKRSCRDWYVVIAEGGKGVQTNAELKNGMKMVYDVARYSEDYDIADAATRQLAAVIANDSEAFAIAGADFGNACKAHGQ